MFTIFSKKTFTACAERLAKSITGKDAIDILQHHIKKAQSADKLALERLVRDISNFTNTNPSILTQSADKTRAANWLSIALSGEDYNATSEKLKSQKTPSLTTDVGIAKARSSIEIFKEYLYSVEHYANTFKSISEHLQSEWSELETQRGEPFSIHHEENTGWSFLLMLIDWAKNDEISYVYTDGYESPSDQRSGSLDWDKYLVITGKNGIEVKFNFEYTDFEESGLDDVRVTITINDKYLESYMSDERAHYEMDHVTDKIESLMIEFNSLTDNIRPTLWFDQDAIAHSFQVFSAALSINKRPANVTKPVSQPSFDALLQMLRPTANRSDIGLTLVQNESVSCVYFDPSDSAESVVEFLDSRWCDLGTAFVSKGSNGEDMVYFSPRKNHFMRLGFPKGSLICYNPRLTQPYFSVEPDALVIETKTGEKLSKN